MVISHIMGETILDSSWCSAPAQVKPDVSSRSGRTRTAGAAGKRKDKHISAGEGGQDRLAGSVSGAGLPVAMWAVRWDRDPGWNCAAARPRFSSLGHRGLLHQTPAQSPCQGVCARYLLCDPWLGNLFSARCLDSHDAVKPVAAVAPGLEATLVRPWSHCLPLVSPCLPLWVQGVRRWRVRCRGD